ncbi:hypothetical protein ACF0H5_000167 [Mactra antiquata]
MDSDGEKKDINRRCKQKMNKQKNIPTEKYCLQNVDISPFNEADDVIPPKKRRKIQVEESSSNVVTVCQLNSDGSLDPSNQNSQRSETSVVNSASEGLNIFQNLRNTTPVKISHDDLTAVSQKVFDLMSCVGYSPTIVKERRQSFRERDSILSSIRNDVTIVTAGSKGEGLTSSFESDYDRLNIYRDIICISPDTYVDIPDATTIIHINDANCHPGHFVLTLSRRGSATFKPIEVALITNSFARNQISSDLFTKELEQTESIESGFGWNRGTRAGPAMTSARGIYQRDDVFAFRCLSQKDILKEWANRERSYGWPSLEIMEEILQLEAQLVPVGCAGSENKSMEWRICFIPGELRLCESLNETQYKLYILLKMVNKFFLKSICSDMSSFMMKNITFWITETNPSEMFCRENLLLVLKLGLDMLIGSLRNKCLPYFMIPIRNLFIGRQCLSSSDALISKLEEIIADCPRVILGLPKFQVAHAGIQIKELVKDGIERDILEGLELKRQYIIASLTKPGLTRDQIDHTCWMDKAYRDARCKMYDMVWPDWKQHFETEKAKCSLETTIDSMHGMKMFPDQYRRFAWRYFDIVWPHVRKFMNGYNEASKDEIVDFLALLRVKVEIALS